MIKKIFISIGVLFSFFLLFLFGFDKINVLAYSDIGNSLGSYPIKLNYENYDNINLIDDSDVFYRPGTVTPYTSIINVENDFIFKANTTYTFKFFQFTTNSSFQLYFNETLSANGGTCGYWSASSNVNTCTIGNSDIIFTGQLIKIASGSISNVGQFMIVDGNVAPDYYSPFFKFGYNAHYNVVLSNSSSSNINAGIGIYDGNKYLYTSNCNVPANSNSTICSSSNNPVYLPFTIDNNGYISFNYNLSLTVGPQGSISVIDGGLAFETVFNAYYKGEYTENLYFNQSYTMNNISLSGFSISVVNSNSNDLFFPSTSFDNTFFINSNNEYNISTNKKITTTFTNNFNYKNFINDSINNIYDFAIKIPNNNLGLNYNISISILMARVLGDVGNTSPLPDNELTNDKYNTCSAWYDIPCQLGNGLTYVIYEAPIISPVLTFIVSFISMFSSLVSFVVLFRSFGIIFGCFIIYMFINLLHKYSK